MTQNKNRPRHTPSAPSAPPAPTLDAAITHALNRVPRTTVPEDFASRVAHRASTQPAPHPAFTTRATSTSPAISPAAHWTSWGSRLAIASGVLLTLAMFAFAPHAAPSFTNARFDAELLLFAELSTLALFAHRLLLPRG